MHLGGLPGGIVGVVISDTPSSCQQLDVWCSHTLQSDRATDYPFIVFHLFSFEKRIYTTLVRSYKILSPLECCRANIHCSNRQLLCLGPWYCGISAAAFRRSDLKEKSLTFYDLRFMIHGRLSGCELGSCQSCFWRCWTLQGVPRCSKCRQVRRERMPSMTNNKMVVRTSEEEHIAGTN